jgi:hypothetical protein
MFFSIKIATKKCSARGYIKNSPRLPYEELMELRILVEADRRLRKSPTGTRFHEGHLFNIQKRVLRYTSTKALIGAIPLLVFYAVLAIIISGCGAGGSNATLISSNSGTIGSKSGGSGPNSSGTPTTSTSGTTTAGTTSSGTTTPGTTTPATLAWVAPLTYQDGITRIEPGDLTGYLIYLYTDSNLTAYYADYLVSGTTTSISLSELNTAVFTDAISRDTSTTYYLTVTAIVTHNGIETQSAYSNSVSYAYP